ncbi:MAG: hypothetical protein QGG34_10760 [SAR202 cluster bacterium]|jgi:hypothetical protein|nr:hypothetical protein [SAR202 cluster bacterium]MDP6300096.1 hypothetical protein [SAR202 cluster bacterium]MDP7103497.1 hypothetical protein [SAR202 cluster bacterium]MDP7225737.1 hypothetical protein [SAR202 cluster bacterium]HJO82349.1 FtsX-like permease family protein [SAR202 cluster bacterium]|tara:strand:- start:7854 stop:11204 length:3351 start_codon:yes stop_codon:yes gene_type:complete
MIGAVVKILSAWPMVIKRSIANWRLLSSVIIGVVLASAIMAGTVIYFDSLKSLALGSELAKHDPYALDILTTATKGPTAPREYALVRRPMEAEIQARVGGILDGTLRGGHTATFFLTMPGQEEHAGEDNARSYFAFAPKFEENVNILPGGRHPTPVLDPVIEGTPLSIEGLAPADAAAEFGVGVGDVLSVVPHWDEVTPYASVEIVGLYERRNPADLFWRLNDRILRAFTSGNFLTVPFFVSEQTFLRGVGSAFPNMDSTYGWLLDVDTDKLSAVNATQTRADIRSLHSRLNTDLTWYQQITVLDTALENYDRRLLFSKLQMFVVLILIAVVVLYYVVTLSSLIAEQRRGEVTLLRSRGAGTNQILAVFVLEGSTIAVVATVVSPFLAAWAISLLGLTPAFADLSGGSRLPVDVSRTAYMLSALGGLLSFGALMIPAIEATKTGVSRHRQESTRPSRFGFFQRYYIDVMMLAVSIVLFRQLAEQGSLAATDLLGEVVVNQLLLAAPAITLVAAAMVLLRLFPVVMSLISRLMSPHLPPGVVMGLWQMARNPTHYARLALLLILMAGLGIFAASFAGTLERSFEERVLYSSGSDIRLTGVTQNTRGITRPLAEPYLDLPGIVGASPALRSAGSDLSILTGESFMILGVDTETFTDVAWFREDFADESIERLMDTMASRDETGGIELPDDSRALEILVKADRPNPTIQLAARLRDANGRFFTYGLGSLETSNWRLMSSSLFEGRRVRFALFPTRPLTLVAIALGEMHPQGTLRSGSLLIDTVRVRRSTGDVVVLDTLGDVAGWNVLRATKDSVQDRIRASEVSARGDGSLQFAWSDGSPLVPRGVYPGPPTQPVPVVASASFIRATGHAVGDELEVSVSGERVNVTIADTVDFFPTMDSFNERFLIADFNALITDTNRSRTFGELRANEMWLSTDLTGTKREELVERLAQGAPYPAISVIDREHDLGEAKIDPLVLAGWRALLLIAFGAILILSSLGFLVHAYVSIRNRELQFALMRTIGFTMRQLVALMWVEQALVIGAGMALGTWMGGRLGSTVMPFLGHDENGSQVLPPFVIEVNWSNLLVTYAAMSIIFTAIILGVIWFVRHMALSRVLRLGDV